MTSENKVFQPPNHTDFICVCGDPDEKERKYAEADALINEACERLSRGSASLGARTVTRENLLDAVVWSLSWDFNASIEGIHNDQWSVVRAERNRFSEDKWISSIQCDHVEHGIAATWLAFANEFPQCLEEEH